ncbi:MAG: rubrerythrin family protein [Dehalogenimonas sp.]|uniref:Rubrerythrin family protein n=1 Tax=Candidatus Dehalogenimonas loeffleri TaxID=3127115 RepID=A0ABZ2J135_9CHLR|nr:rubrerythrin family protein [Dehalogenimonas sp.]
MGNTEQNLAAAFAGESQASRKYLFFAEKAETEGLPQIARLFRAASEAETVHARNHLRVIKGIEDTSSNLKAAISGEQHEFSSMYPDFIEQARKEGQERAELSFQSANAVEKIHHSLFQKALNDVGLGMKIEEKPYFVCQVCGNTVLEVPDNCPICNAPRTSFKKVD